MRLLSGSTDKYIYMFDAQTGAKLQSWKGHIVHDLIVSHDGRYLISTTSERKVNRLPERRIPTECSNKMQQFFTT